MTRLQELLAYIDGLLASNRRMRECLNTLAREQQGRATRRTVVEVCGRVTADDLRDD